MQARTKDIIKLIDEEASFDFAEDWDNSGLQAGDMSWKIKKILIALDPTEAAMHAAVNNEADLLLTHHPLFIKLPGNIDFSCMPGKAISIAAKEKISIVCAHTNLDKAMNGLNDYFAKLIGLKEILPLNIHDTYDNPCTIGRKGKLKKKKSLEDFALEIKKTLNLNYVRIIGDPRLLINSATVVTGSGGSLIESFFQSKTDVFITGDVKYHEARIIEENKTGMIDVGHFGSEYIAIQLLADKLVNASKIKNFDFEVIKYKNETDPFNIV